LSVTPQGYDSKQTNAQNDSPGSLRQSTTATTMAAVAAIVVVVVVAGRSFHTYGVPLFSKRNLPGTMGR
jgi:hypothetical protein